MKTENLKIGQLAERAGVSVETIRFYESKGLISPAGRSANGYRLYNELDGARLRFILNAKSVGFTLKEITDLLALRVHADHHTCEDVKQLTHTKMHEIAEKIAQLTAIHNSLQGLHNACCGGPESAENCSILEYLDNK